MYLNFPGQPNFPGIKSASFKQPIYVKRMMLEGMVAWAHIAIVAFKEKFFIYFLNIFYITWITLANDSNGANFLIYFTSVRW